MVQRSEERIATNPVLIGVTGMGELRNLRTTGLVLDASNHGLRIVVKERIPVGSLLRLYVEGSKMTGQVRHCQERTGGYAIGLEILVGASELARILERAEQVTSVKASPAS